MSRKIARQGNLRAQIAAAAARIMAEDGVDDFALAKRKAARQLGAAHRHAMPGNDEIEEELRAYRSLYQPEEHSARIAELRRLALAAMRLLERFNPYLTGTVLSGIAGPYAAIEIQLFPESAKDVELFLLDRNLPYTTAERRRYSGETFVRYVFGYALLRFAIELFRGDPRGSVFSVMSTSQFIAACGILAGLAIYALRRRIPPAPRPA